MPAKITKTIQTTQEYRDAMKCAEGLDLELTDVSASGGWETKDGESVFLSGYVELENVGHKYFHIILSGPDGAETWPCQPTRTTTRDKGTLTLKFTQ